jgi:hypothetical protein
MNKEKQIKKEFGRLLNDKIKELKKQKKKGVSDYNLDFAIIVLEGLKFKWKIMEIK